MVMNQSWMETVAVISVGFAVAVFSATVLLRIQELLRRPESGAESEVRIGPSAVLKPLLAQLAVVLQRIPVFSRLLKQGALQWYPLLVRAGQPGGLTGEEFVALRWLALILVPILIGIASGGRSPILLVIGVLFGYLAPGFWLTSIIARRTELILSELPGALDLISLMTGAGLDLGQAMAYYALGARRTPLIELFRQADRHMQLGRTRTEALQYLARIADVPALTQVVSGLVQAERLGAPIAPFLAEQSQDQRDARFSRAEESGQKAPVKLLGPLLIFIVPGVFLVVFGPMALQFVTGQG